jgi:hypothetical protein
MKPGPLSQSQFERIVNGVRSPMLSALRAVPDAMRVDASRNAPFRSLLLLRFLSTRVSFIPFQPIISDPRVRQLHLGALEGLAHAESSPAMRRPLLLPAPDARCEKSTLLRKSEQSRTAIGFRVNSALVAVKMRHELKRNKSRSDSGDVPGNRSRESGRRPKSRCSGVIAGRRNFQVLRLGAWANWTRCTMKADSDQFSVESRVFDYYEARSRRVDIHS